VHQWLPLLLPLLLLLLQPPFGSIIRWLQWAVQ
jgi:hypothetical protein